MAGCTLLGAGCVAHLSNISLVPRRTIMAREWYCAEEVEPKGGFMEGKHGFLLKAKVSAATDAISFNTLVKAVRGCDLKPFEPDIRTLTANIQENIPSAPLLDPREWDLAQKSAICGGLLCRRKAWRSF